MTAEGQPQIGYDCGPMDGTAVWERTCPQCGRYVTADGTLFITIEPSEEPRWIEHRTYPPNATCKVHGRVTMSFLGYW